MRGMLGFVVWNCVGVASWGGWLSGTVQRLGWIRSMGASKQPRRAMSPSEFFTVWIDETPRGFCFYSSTKVDGSMSIIGSSAISAAFGFSLMSAGTESDRGISESR